MPNWSKGIIFTFLKRRPIACCYEHRDLWKVKKKNMKWWPVTSEEENPAHVSIYWTWTKCNGWKSSVFVVQNPVRITNPEVFSSVGQIHLEISFLKAQNNLFWEKELWTYNNINSQNKTLIPFRFKFYRKQKFKIFTEFSFSPALIQVINGCRNLAV